MEKLITKIIKVGQYQFMQSLRNKGEVYFNTADFFKKADNNKERFDAYETAEDIDQVEWIKLEDETGKIYNLATEKGKGIHLSNANLVTYNDTIKRNVFSCTGVTKENVNEFKKINPKFSEFGNAVLLIENPHEFFTRIENELKKQRLDYRIGLGNYYNPFTKIGSLSVYDKKEEHSYQHEIRIWINYPENKPIIINIGSIKDFTRIFKIEELLEL
jgi:hypothetical protein